MSNGGYNYKQDEDYRKFTRLKSLDCFEEVNDLLKRGHSYQKVAEIIQDHYGEYQDVKQRSLANVLRSYAKEEIPAAEKVSAGRAKELDEQLDKLEGQVHVLQELEKLLKLQKERININYKQEQKGELLLKSTNKEIQTAADLVDLIGAYQQDYGLTPRNVGTLKHEINFDESGKEISKEGEHADFIEDEQEQKKMLGFIEDLEKADDEVIDVVAGEGEEDEDDVIDAEYDEVDE